MEWSHALYDAAKLLNNKVSSFTRWTTFVAGEGNMRSTERIVFIQTVATTSDCVKQEVKTALRVFQMQGTWIYWRVLVHSEIGCVHVCQQGAVIKLLSYCYYWWFSSSNMHEDTGG